MCVTDIGICIRRIVSNNQKDDARSMFRIDPFLISTLNSDNNIFHTNVSVIAKKCNKIIVR